MTAKRAERETGGDPPRSRTGRPAPLRRGGQQPEAITPSPVRGGGEAADHSITAACPTPPLPDAGAPRQARRSPTRALPLAALLTLSAALAQTAAPSAPTQPVLVRLGTLAWVYAAGGQPSLSGGRVTVPAAPACALLGLTRPCSGRAELRTLTDEAGLSLSWNAASRAAIVGGPARGGWKDAADLLAGRGSDALSSATPLNVALGPVTSGSPGRELRLGSPAAAPYRALTLSLVAQVGNTLTLSGDLAPGSADVKNTARACVGGSCRVRFDRAADWVLAAVGVD
jgi:hypothetical protein